MAEPVPVAPIAPEVEPETEPSAKIKPARPKRPLTDERKEQLTKARAKALEVRRERAGIKKAEREAMTIQWEARRKMTEKKLVALKKEEDDEPPPLEEDWDEFEDESPPSPRQSHVVRPPPGPPPTSRSTNHPERHQPPNYVRPNQAAQGWADPQQGRAPELDYAEPAPQYSPMAPPPRSAMNYGGGGGYMPRNVGFQEPPTHATRRRAYNREPVPLDRPADEYSLADLEEMTARDAYGQRMTKLKQEMAYKSIFR
tara:strand:- start:4556 stop:5323 length:768 start_codon:yes stop_codon:yes gene_type:complete